MGRLFTLTPVNGSPLVLNDRANGYRVLKGVAGLNMPGFDLRTSDSPQLDGEQLDDVAVRPRSIFLPMMVTGRTEGEFRERAEALIDAVFPLRGMAMLEVAQPDGQRRSVTVIYDEGLHGSEGITDGGQTWWRFGLRLSALSPWWESAPISQTWAWAATVPFLPITPRRVNSSSTFDRATLYNPGNVEAYAVWTVTGPTGGIELARLDTGEAFTVTGPLAAGRGLTIHTKPGEVAVTLDTGENWWSHLGAESSLWRLPPGPDATPITLSLSDAALGTMVRVDYTPRHITCL